MSAKRFALFGGIFMLAIGLLALVPLLSRAPDNLPDLKIATSYGLFLGILPMNLISKIALITLGLIGISASLRSSTRLPSSINFSRLIFVLMTLAVVLGVIPETSTLFGYVPLFGSAVLLNAFFAILGAYTGFALTSEVPRLADYNEARQPTRGAGSKVLNQH